ncbi:putative TOS1-like glycosyl hydrolase-domain-containing protein [Xylariaceae sp. FL0662B]|nr:putative TOS1-like glycosyl hydrolase-domain-containing protein [Xylariaceae sp. FL0662B]
MKYSSAIMVAAASVANAGFCTDAFEEFGNFFCPNAVKQIKYSGLDIPGKYRAVSKMDNTGVCEFEDKDYSGPIAPFDEGLAAVFRGPVTVSQFAVYTPSKGKRDVPKVHSKRHGHQHLHRKHQEQQQQEEKRADIVTATMDGKVVTWENNYFGGAATAVATAAANAASTVKAAASAVESAVNPDKPKSSGTDQPEVAVGDYARVAYYNAKDQVADGLVFLANVGDPAISGTWDTVWGNSLAYVNEEGIKAAASPTVLKDVLLNDDAEIVIMSDQECDESCGTVRPGAVANKGFEGKDKVFLAEFTMPYSGKQGFNADMPAYWFLNAAIPRTGQYSKCSCWSGDNSSPQEGGCGEADIVEILRSGDSKAKSTFHFAQGTGDSHYFDRPADKPMKIAVVFQSSTATADIKVLDDDFDFGTSLAADQVTSMMNDETESNLFSLMSFVS